MKKYTMELTKNEVDWVINKKDICRYIEEIEKINKKMDSFILGISEDYIEMKCDLTKITESNQVLGELISNATEIISDIDKSNQTH